MGDKVSALDGIVFWSAGLLKKKKKGPLEAQQLYLLQYECGIFKRLS
jgi:hypothetical protein